MTKTGYDVAEFGEPNKMQMVRTLFSSHGAGQDEAIFKFAADVEVDQTTEIQRMLTMLLEIDSST